MLNFKKNKKDIRFSRTNIIARRPAEAKSFKLKLDRVVSNIRNLFKVIFSSALLKFQSRNSDTLTRTLNNAYKANNASIGTIPTASMLDMPDFSAGLTTGQAFKSKYLAATQTKWCRGSLLAKRSP